MCWSGWWRNTQEREDTLQAHPGQSPNNLLGPCPPPREQAEALGGGFLPFLVKMGCRAQNKPHRTEQEALLRSLVAQRQEFHFYSLLLEFVLVFELAATPDEKPEQKWEQQPKHLNEFAVQYLTERLSIKFGNLCPLQCLILPTEDFLWLHASGCGVQLYNSIYLYFHQKHDQKM